MSSKQLKTKAVTTLGVIIARLEYLIDSLKKGYLAVTAPGKALILQPQGPIQFDLRATVKPHKTGASHQLSVKMKWERKSDAWRNIIRIPGQPDIAATPVAGLSFSPSPDGPTAAAGSPEDATLTSPSPGVERTPSRESDIHPPKPAIESGRKKQPRKRISQNTRKTESTRRKTS